MFVCEQFSRSICDAAASAACFIVVIMRVRLSMDCFCWMECRHVVIKCCVHKYDVYHILCMSGKNRATEVDECLLVAVVGAMSASIDMMVDSIVYICIMYILLAI